jgi:hypothetical protein
MGNCGFVHKISVLLKQCLTMEVTMGGKLPLATALFVIGTFFGPTIATSAPITPPTANIGAA